MHIHELSDYQIYKLKSIDPNLSSDWINTVKTIFPKLNRESKESIYKNILEPRGIYIDTSRKIKCKPAATLQSILPSIRTQHKELLSAASHMLRMLNNPKPRYDALELAEEIEALLNHFDNINLHDSIEDKKHYYKIRKAYLYDLARWIDTIELTISRTLRKLNDTVIKAYFKEVFIRNQLQGRDFRAWDSSDFNFKHLDHIPPFVKKMGTKRKLYVVEGKDYWFLVGTPSSIHENPYSFRRFVYEDLYGGSLADAYLTHVVVEKNNLQDSKYQKFTYYCINRIYTLDRGASPNLIKFINESQQAYYKHIKPILKNPIRNDGNQPEVAIENRMAMFEKKVTTLILLKLPAMLEIALDNDNDKDYLFYQFDKLLKQMLDNLEDFRLRPLVRYSPSSEVMVVKLVTMRTLLSRMKNLITESKTNFEEATRHLQLPLATVKDKVEETLQYLEQINEFHESIKQYESDKASNKLWDKIKTLKKPKYTLQELEKIKLNYNEDCYMTIVRLAKERNDGMVYMEFDCNEIINENYRHYALANGAWNVSSLPKVTRLNEDRHQFDTYTITEEVLGDISQVNRYTRKAS